MNLPFHKEPFFSGKHVQQQLNLLHYLLLFLPQLPVYLKLHSHPRHKLKINFASPNYKFRPFYVREISTLIISWKQQNVNWYIEGKPLI